METNKGMPQDSSMDAILKNAARWVALRNNGWTLYEVLTETRVANTTGRGPTYTKGVKHAGWTLSCMSSEEFDTQDEAIDEAMRRFAPQASVVPVPAQAAAPESLLPLHEDRIKELAEEFQMELMHCGLEVFTLERMLTQVVDASDEAAKAYAKENGTYPLAAIPLSKDARASLARRYQDELLSNGVEPYYLKQMVRDVLALVYPRMAARGAAG